LVGNIFASREVNFVSATMFPWEGLQLISYNFSVNVANFVPNFVVKFKSS
jgi:hypothetical protein